MFLSSTRIDPKDFEERFVQLDHTEYCQETNLNRKVEIFTENVTKILDELVPLRKVTSKLSTSTRS